MTRLRILYSGRVQGVGFRAAVAHLARRFAGVTGFVRNLPDGRVEVVVEGERDDVDALLAAVAERMRGHVGAADRSTAEPTGEFTAFDVTW